MYNRVFFHVCLQINPESYEWGLSARSFDLKSIAVNDNKVVKQTMLNFKRAAILRDELYSKRSVHDALCICCFNITIY